jgi:hypothetical protein
VLQHPILKYFLELERFGQFYQISDRKINLVNDYFSIVLPDCSQFRNPRSVQIHQNLIDIERWINWDQQNFRVV